MQVILENEPSGIVKVTVEEDNLRATGWISSHHLVDPKVAQLKAMLRREGERAFLETS